MDQGNFVCVLKGKPKGFAEIDIIVYDNKISFVRLTIHENDFFSLKTYAFILHVSLGFDLTVLFAPKGSDLGGSTSRRQAP